MSLFKRALRHGFSLNWKSFMDSKALVVKFLVDDTFEKTLLDGVFFMVRNEVGDLELALDAFRNVLKHLSKYAFSGSLRLACKEKYAFELYVLALYAKASCYYYGERDFCCFCAFRRYLDVLRRCQRRSVCGIVNIDDIQRKFDSLAFLRREYKQVVHLIQLGDFSSAARLLDASIEKIGVEYLDHEVVLSAAQAHMAIGHMHLGSALARVAYQDSPRCMETQFVFALSLFVEKGDASLLQFVELTDRFVDMNAHRSCKISFAKRSRMKIVLDDLKKCVCMSNDENGLTIIDGCNSKFVYQGRLKISECMLYISASGVGDGSKPLYKDCCSRGSFPWDR